MSRLVRFADNGAGSWARIDLDDGSPLFISLEQAGVTVRKSRISFFGPQIYKETAVARLVHLCCAVESRLCSFALPSKMKNPVLRVFTKLALQSSSVGDFLMCVQMRICQHNNAA
jgi:hypothetical protein